MIISKREQKRRLHKLQHMSAEEQMIEHYLQQEKRAFTIGTQIERNAFEIGKGVRIRKRAKNTFSKEEFGTCGSTISVRKFAVSQEFVEKRGTSVRTYTLTSYTNIVCKSRNMY